MNLNVLINWKETFVKLLGVSKDFEWLFRINSIMPPSVGGSVSDIDVITASTVDVMV